MSKPVKPMLAKDADLSKLAYPDDHPQAGNLKKTLAVQPKLDGIRAMVIDGKLRSRTLKPIPNAEIRAALERPEFEGFDGEIVVGDPTAEDAYRKTSSFVMSESKTGADWVFHVFDLWDHPGIFGERHRALVERGPSTQRVRTLAYEVVQTVVALENIEEALIAEGVEGVIARTLDQPYKFGRSGKTGPLLKIKRFIDFEAEIVGVFEEMHNGNVPVTNLLGRTERSTSKAGLVGKGTLGGFYVRAINGPAEGVEFKVGTGFTAAMRDQFWSQRNDYVNAAGTSRAYVVKVKSFPVGVKDKPRHPVFLGFRDMAVDG